MTVDAARWQRVETALEAAMEAPAAERGAVLDRLCEGDVDLRREVESLLAAHAAAGGFLETTAADFVAARLVELPAEPAEPPGAIVGRYRLLEEIGRGGMGAVWLAERADGHFEQRVALKLVKRGMDTDEILSRFLRERQILARLEHSHIARLLDGGVSDDGRPYFVMEHVAGESITEYCDQQRLSIEHRLRLFVDVCRAIDHAHRNLVVHRDIKPTNVLVTKDGEIKLLDFGIAKLLGDEDGAATRAAGAASEIMTPEYASPEQAAGEPITTMSDVYQLGVLLYELLTGHLPHVAEGRTPSTIRQRIQEATPARPSTAVRSARTIVHRNGTAETIDPVLVSGRRDTTPERLQRQLRGDLDTIAMRALRKEPDRRYPSVEALAEDVERHLAVLPIRFGGDRFTYRAGRFMRRNRLRVATAAVLLVVSAGSLVFYTLEIRRERDRARLEAAKSAGSAEMMRAVFESWDPDAADRGEVDAIAVLRSAVQTTDQNLRNQPDMLAASLSVLGELFASLEESETADSLFLRALAIQEGQAEPSADLAATLARRGRLLTAYGRPAEGGRVLQRALALHRGLFGERNVETLRVERDLAVNLRARTDFPAAERLLRDVLQSLDEDGRNTSPFALETAAELGYVLFLQGRYDEAITTLRATRERQQRQFGLVYGPSIPTTRYLASALRDRGDLDEAESLYREALRISRTLYGEESRHTAWSLGVLSIALERKGELEEAESLARHQIDILSTVYGPENPLVGQEIMRLGGIRLDRGDPIEAERLLIRGLEILLGGHPAGHPDEGDGLNRLAYAFLLRDAPEFEEAYGAAVAFDRARPVESAVFVSDGIHFLAWAEHREGDLAEAEADYRRALGLYRRQLPPGHVYRAAAATGLGAVLLDAGHRAEAERYLREGLVQWERNPGADPARLVEARSLLEQSREGH